MTNAHDVPTTANSWATFQLTSVEKTALEQFAKNYLAESSTLDHSSIALHVLRLALMNPQNLETQILGVLRYIQAEGIENTADNHFNLGQDRIRATLPKRMKARAQ